jgi:formyltetrahydrofolate-dependent phosphoribosylglycinamide formyltransferase
MLHGMTSQATQVKPIPTRTPGVFRLAVLISGGGTTLQNLAQWAAKRNASTPGVQIEIALVISSSPTVFGVTRAANLGLPCVIVSRKDFKDTGGTQAFSAKIFDSIRAAKVDLVCMAGFLSLIQIPEDFSGRVINIHPSLLPKFGGKGMYGHFVHEAVLAAGSKQSGCTVHYADAQFDTGPIIVQRTCPVLEGDTPTTLAARVFEQECLAYPQAIEKFVPAN